MLGFPDYLEGLIVVALAVGAAIIGLNFVQRRVSLEHRMENNEVAGFIYATVGVVYAVILAFVVIIVWEQLTDAEKTVQLEANALVDLVRDTKGFPDSVQHGMREAVRSYVETVVSVEWETMKHGEESDAAHDKMLEVWRKVHDLRPETELQRIYFAQCLEKINIANDERRLRILACRTGVPRVMWMLLFGGGIITVGFSFLFGTKHVKLQLVKTAALSGMIAFVLYLILLLNHPFGGGVSADDAAFNYILHHIHVDVGG